MTTCKEKLVKYLRDNNVAFESMTHRTAFTAQEVAAEQKVKGKQVAKVVIVLADGKTTMLVLPASYKIDFAKLQVALKVKETRLAKEDEFGGLFPDCEVGAMPPFGHLYNVPVYVDASLSDVPEIVFQAGTHTETLKVRYADFARLAQPTVVEFAVHL